MSVYQPPLFKNFGKAPNDLFQVYEKDSLDHVFKQTTRNTIGGTNEYSIVSAPKQAPRGVIKTNFGVNGNLVTVTLNTDATKTSSVEVTRKNVLAKQAPGVNVTVAVESASKDFSAVKPKYGFFSTLKADYTRNNFSADVQATSDEDSNHAFTASASVGFEGFAVGGDVKLVKSGDAPVQAKAYNAGLAYNFKKYYTASLASDSKFEKLKATFVAARVNGSPITFGLQGKIDLQAPKSGAPQRELIASVEEKATPATTYKLAAVLTNGTIVAGVEHKFLNPNIAVSATVVTQLPNSAFAPFGINKFGVGVTLGDY